MDVDESGRLFTASYDGRVCTWNEGTAKEITGSGHSNQVTGIAASKGGDVYTSGMDDTLRSISSMKFTYGYSYLIP
jgi:WD40 repeat protein